VSAANGAVAAASGGLGLRLPGCLGGGLRLRQLLFFRDDRRLGPCLSATQNQRASAQQRRATPLRYDRCLESDAHLPYSKLE
jgi:hypothetical protein